MPESTTSDTAYSAMSDTCKPFSTPSTTLEESPTPSRDTAPSSIPADNGQPMKTPQQSSEQGYRSKLVTQMTKPEQPTSTGTRSSTSDRYYGLFRLVDMLHTEHREKVDLLLTQQKNK